MSRVEAIPVRGAEDLSALSNTELWKKLLEERQAARKLREASSNVGLWGKLTGKSTTLRRQYLQAEDRVDELFMATGSRLLGAPVDALVFSAGPTRVIDHTASPPIAESKGFFANTRDKVVGLFGSRPVVAEDEARRTAVVAPKRRGLVVGALAGGLAAVCLVGTAALFLNSRETPRINVLAATATQSAKKIEVPPAIAPTVSAKAGELNIVGDRAQSSTPPSPQTPAGAGPEQAPAAIIPPPKAETRNVPIYRIEDQTTLRIEQIDRAVDVDIPEASKSLVQKLNLKLGVVDNPYGDPHYKEVLSREDLSSMKGLVEGRMWDYYQKIGAIAEQGPFDKAKHGDILRTAMLQDASLNQRLGIPYNLLFDLNPEKRFAPGSDFYYNRQLVQPIGSEEWYKVFDSAGAYKKAA